MIRAPFCSAAVPEVCTIVATSPGQPRGQVGERPLVAGRCHHGHPAPGFEPLGDQAGGERPALRVERRGGHVDRPLGAATAERDVLRRRPDAVGEEVGDVAVLVVNQCGSGRLAPHRAFLRGGRGRKLLVLAAYSAQPGRPAMRCSVSGRPVRKARAYVIRSGDTLTPIRWSRGPGWRGAQVKAIDFRAACVNCVQTWSGSAAGPQ